MSPGAPHVLSQAILGLGPVLADFLPDSFRAVSALPKMGGREGLYDFSRGGTPPVTSLLECFRLGRMEARVVGLGVVGRQTASGDRIRFWFRSASYFRWE